MSTEHQDTNHEHEPQAMNEQPEITTVLFDAGGTLVHADVRFIHQTLHQAGITATLQVVRKAEGSAKRAIDRRMQEAMADTDETRRQPYFAAMLDHMGIKKDLAARLLDIFEAEHRKRNLWRSMSPSTPQVLQELRDRGLVLGVVSNSDGRIASVLESCGIAQYFQVIVDSHDVGVEKPDPRIFRYALKKAKATPEQTLYVGDIHSIDIVGAERAGIRAVLLDNGSGYFPPGCKIIHRLHPVLRMV